MKITNAVLFFALFGLASARLNEDAAEDQDQRSLADDKVNGNSANAPGQNKGPAVTSNSHFPPGQLKKLVPEEPSGSAADPGFGVTPSDPSVFAADDNDDELDILVRFKNNNGKNKVKSQAKSVKHEYKLADFIAMRATKKVILKLAKDPDIETIELDSLVYPTADFTTYNAASGEWISYGIPFTQSDSTVIPSSTTVGDCNDPSSFKIAIIDTGYWVNHPDSPCGGENCIGETFVSDPWDAPSRQWHGTHVMGIIGGVGGSGEDSNVGVIPQLNNICYMHYRVFDESGAGAQWSTIFAAVEKAVDDKAKVINMSLSGGWVSNGQQFFTNADAAGTLVVAAAGNTGSWYYSYPSSYERVISVGALNNNNWWAYFSTCNYALDICAPGYNIWSESTIDGAWGWYEYSSGTSMAAPFVTGVIAKIWSQCPACSHTDVEYCIKDTAQYIGYQWWCFGWGEVQAEAAYTCLVDDVQCCN